MPQRNYAQYVAASALLISSAAMAVVPVSAAPAIAPTASLAGKVANNHISTSSQVPLEQPPQKNNLRLTQLEQANHEALARNQELQINNVMSVQVQVL